jgi:hypothetical protein
MKKFRTWCTQSLRKERTSLKKIWIDKNKRSRTKPGPEDVDPMKWKKLVDYWTSPEGLARSERMKATRSCVTDLSRVGRGGVQAAERRAVRFFSEILLNCDGLICGLGKLMQCLL